MSDDAKAAASWRMKRELRFPIMEIDPQTMLKAFFPDKVADEESQRRAAEAMEEVRATLGCH